MSWLGEEREAHLLGLLRVLFAGLLLLLTLRFFRELFRDGYFGDVFHLSLLPQSLVASRSMYLGLLVCQAVGCVLSLLGIAARPALGVAALCGLYGFFGDRLQYHNNRYELLLLAFLVALTPCDRSFVLFGRARPGPAPRWAARLVGAQLSIVYLSSSIGKLSDPDWRSGAVLLPRFAVGRPVVEHVFSSGVANVLSATWFAHTASLGAIGSELFLALGPWFRRTRVLALWLGVMFHAGIEISAHVELFSYTMIAGYLVFVTPELRERRLSWNVQQPAGKRLRALFERLDFFARFQHASSADQTALLVVHDRAGLAYRGLGAVRELARATPVLFPLWLPLALLSFRQRGQAASSKVGG